MSAPTPKPPTTTSRTPVQTTIIPKPITTTLKPTNPSTIAPPITTSSTIKTTTTTTTTPPSRVITFTSDSTVSRPPKTTASINVATGDSEGMSPGAVAGMSAGVLAVLIGSVVGAFMLLKQRKKRMFITGSSRKYKGYPEPDLSRLPVQRYKPDTDNEAAPADDDDNALYRNSTLGTNGRRRIDVTSSYYDDEFNKANRSGYSESWTGFVANGRRQGSESGQRIPSSTEPLAASATSLPLRPMSSQEVLQENGSHELGYGSDEHLEPQNMAHVMSMTMPRALSMRSSGYGYDHVPPMPMGNPQPRGSGYYPPPQLRPHPSGLYPGPHPYDLQGFQRPVSAYVPGPGSPPGSYTRPPHSFNHPYQHPRPQYGRVPPGGAPRPYSAFSTTDNLQLPYMPYPQSASASELNSPISPVSPVSPSSTLVSPVSPTSTLLSNPQLYTSDDPSAVVPAVTGGDPLKTSDAISTESGSQSLAASPVFPPENSSPPNAVPGMDDKPEAGKVGEAVVVSFNETNEQLDGGKEEVLLEPVEDAASCETPAVPPPIILATKPTTSLP